MASSELSSELGGLEGIIALLTGLLGGGSSDGDAGAGE